MHTAVASKEALSCTGLFVRLLFDCSLSAMLLMVTRDSSLPKCERADFASDVDSMSWDSFVTCSPSDSFFFFLPLAVALAVAVVVVCRPSPAEVAL